MASTTQPDQPPVAQALGHRSTKTLVSEFVGNGRRGAHSRTVWDNVSCSTCMQTAIPVPDADGYVQSWHNACSLRRERRVPTVVEHLHDVCARSRIHFVSERFAFPELLELIAAELVEHNFADMLKSILDDTEDNQLADRRHSPLAAGTGRRRRIAHRRY